MIACCTEKTTSLQHVSLQIRRQHPYRDREIHGSYYDDFAFIDAFKTKFNLRSTLSKVETLAQCSTTVDIVFSRSHPFSHLCPCVPVAPNQFSRNDPMQSPDLKLVDLLVLGDCGFCLGTSDLLVARDVETETRAI